MLDQFDPNLQPTKETNIVIPTTIEGEVLAYEGHTIVSRIDRACWRLADALGLIATLRPDVMGVARFTGRGYKIQKAADAQAR